EPGGRNSVADDRAGDQDGNKGGKARTTGEEIACKGEKELRRRGGEVREIVKAAPRQRRRTGEELQTEKTEEKDARQVAKVRELGVVEFGGHRMGQAVLPGVKLGGQAVAARMGESDEGPAAVVGIRAARDQAHLL